jgi:hypothetical protein
MGMELLAFVAILVVFGAIAAMLGADTRPADTASTILDW